MNSAMERPRILFVDDEENVLHGLARQVHDHYEAELVTSPLTGARLLGEAVSDDGAGFAAVVSDMRMPEMDGRTLLRHALEVSPDTTRLLLTGYADLPTAISVVNESNVFRFLTKPCPAAELCSSLRAAVDQHRLLRGRRDLLEETLRGAVAALVETLAMAQPAVFARASRLGRLTRAVARRLRLPDAWQAEVAAQLGEIGLITLPPQALHMLDRGAHASPDVSRMLETLPGLADGVLSPIPRLEHVREIITVQQPVGRPDARRLAAASRAARVVQAVREFDVLVAQRNTAEIAVLLLRQRSYHDIEVLDALDEVAGTARAREAREIDVSGLRAGQVLAADLVSGNGTLLVHRGHVLTDEVLARIRDFTALNGLAGRPIVVDPPVPHLAGHASDPPGDR